VQHIHSTAFASVSASDRKAVALSAYDAACVSPAGADWRMVADLLRAALPASKARPAASGGVPTWWADYALPRDYKQESLAVTFADGVTVRCNVHTAARKPPRIAKACRVAIAFYRARTGRSGVPEMVDVRNVGTGATFDAAECSRLTADLRDFSYQPPRWDLAPVPALNGPEGETDVERAERMFGGRWYQNAKGDVLRAHDAPGIAWDGEAEQFGCDEAYAAGTTAERAKALAAIYREAGRMTREEAAEARAAHRAEIEDAAQAEWIEAVADAYSECKPAEIGGTDEPADAEPVAVVTLQSEPVAAPAPVETHASVAVEPEAWEPSAETHPVLAYCNSRAARAKLFAAVQDGTFPAKIQGAKAGVFRLTLADARDCARIARIKLVAPCDLAA
jgi:hypothetical protein